jgi:uncharacterized protein (TIGR03435 family)
MLPWRTSIGVAIVAAIAFCAPALAAQPAGASPRFRRASVAPSRSADSHSRTRFEPDGRWTATNITLQELIELAYQRHGFDRREVLGGPAWMDSERFDVDAKAPEEHILSPDGFPRQTWLMLRALLAERFNLGVRSEKREGPVYELVTVNADGRLGPRLRRSDVDCGVVMMMSIRGERPMNPTCSFAPYPGRLVATAVTMPDLASVLSETVDRGVVDRTSLEGNFDLDVEGVEFRPKGPFGPSSRPSDTTESLFTTLPEQLGLKLEPRNGFREIIIVDSADKPALD